MQCCDILMAITENLESKLSRHLIEFFFITKTQENFITLSEKANNLYPTKEAHYLSTSNYKKMDNYNQEREEYPSYFRNEILELMPCFDLILTRLIEVEDLELFSKFVDFYHSISHLHEYPLTFMRDVLFIYQPIFSKGAQFALKILKICIKYTTVSEQLKNFVQKKDSSFIDENYIKFMLNSVAKLLSVFKNSKNFSGALEIFEEFPSKEEKQIVFVNIEFLFSNVDLLSYFKGLIKRESQFSIYDYYTFGLILSKFPANLESYVDPLVDFVNNEPSLLCEDESYNIDFFTEISITENILESSIENLPNKILTIFHSLFLNGGILKAVGVFNHLLSSVVVKNLYQLAFLCKFVGPFLSRTLIAHQIEPTNNRRTSSYGKNPKNLYDVPPLDCYSRTVVHLVRHCSSIFSLQNDSKKRKLLNFSKFEVSVFNFLQHCLFTLEKLKFDSEHIFNEISNHLEKVPFLFEFNNKYNL